MNIQIGLMNREDKYLTAETFGNQINVTASSMKSKQIWTFIPQSGDQNKGYLQSPQKKYLETSKNGNVICESEEKDEGYLFQVEVADNGKWAFKDIFGKYLAGNIERLYTVMSQKLNEEVLWAVHYAGHPQCILRNISRKQYVHLENEELRANEDIPWGKDAVLTLHFEKGLYCIQDAEGNYLDGVTGDLVKDNSNSTKFILYIQGSHFAFKSFENKKFMTVYGPKAKIIASKNSIGKDEIFLIEDSKAQVVLTANNNKNVSVKQGIDVTANQFMDIGDTEIFQIDYHQGRKDKATFLCRNKKYWSSDEKSVTASASKTSPNSVFEIVQLEGKVALKAFNGKYVTSSTGGQLAPTSSDTSNPSSLFTLTLVNRPLLILRGKYGYIGSVSHTNKVQCNRGSPGIVQVLHEFNGIYRLKTGSDQFWQLDSDGFIISENNEGDSFTFELQGNNLIIRASNGMILTGDKNGMIQAKGNNIDCNGLWEY